MMNKDIKILQEYKQHNYTFSFVLAPVLYIQNPGWPAAVNSEPGNHSNLCCHVDEFEHRHGFPVKDVLHQGRKKRTS